MDWMPWQMALKVAAALLAVGLIWRPSGRRARIVTALCREASLVMGLYALWFYMGTIGRTRVDGALERGQEIWDVEQAMHLPSEVTVQGWFLGHDTVIRLLNLYYGWVHVPALIVFLLWLFLRHRDQYSTWRTSLALMTLACFVIQLVPTAPPRLFPEIGIVDTGRVYGHSAYPGAVTDPGPAQLSAFPSVHVAWAVLIAWAAWSVSRSPWRWIAVAHLVMTVLVVVITGNHWWLDGLAAAVILILVRAAMVPARALAEATRRAFRRPEVAPGVALARSDAMESPDG